MTRPILYSFRRCPYAMRARLAVASAEVEVELREILLRDKAPAFLAASPSATVPALVEGDLVIDESLDIMHWALAQNDPEGWLSEPAEALISEADGPFKTALDRYKYDSRYDGANREEEREKAALFLWKLDEMLNGQDYLFGAKPTLADMAIAPFVRQFAHVDLGWFMSEPWPNLIRWLEAFKSSDRFAAIFKKYPKWEQGDAPTLFP